MAETFEIYINEHSRVPKYKQIVDSILNGIDGGGSRSEKKSLPSMSLVNPVFFHGIQWKSLQRAEEKANHRICKRQRILYFRVNKNDIINIFFLINKPSTIK
jgi:hypothetical protein